MFNKIKVLIAIYKLKRLHFDLETATTAQLLELHTLASTVQHLSELPQAATTVMLIEECLAFRGVNHYI